MRARTVPNRHDQRQDGQQRRQEGERQSPWIRSREAISFPEFFDLLESITQRT